MWGRYGGETPVEGGPEDREAGCRQGSDLLASPQLPPFIFFLYGASYGVVPHTVYAVVHGEFGVWCCFIDKNLSRKKVTDTLFDTFFGFFIGYY